MQSTRGVRWRRIGALLILAVVSCTETEAEVPDAPVVPQTAWVEIAGQLFELELALDPATRFRGLSGRRSVAPEGGMLFVNRQSRRLLMVMRDCPIPLDVAFLDRAGWVLAIHEMVVESPRGRDESQARYEERLPAYDSDVPAWFAVETAAGRLRALGLKVGDRLVFDSDALITRAR